MGRLTQSGTVAGVVGLLREGDELGLLRIIDGGGVDWLKHQDIIVDSGTPEFTENGW